MQFPFTTGFREEGQKKLLVAVGKTKTPGWHLPTSAFCSHCFVSRGPTNDSSTSTENDASYLLIMLNCLYWRYQPLTVWASNGRPVILL